MGRPSSVGQPKALVQAQRRRFKRAAAVGRITFHHDSTLGSLESDIVATVTLLSTASINLRQTRIVTRSHSTGQ